MRDRRLVDLTDDRLDDAKALFSADRHSGAYYMAGYAAECALKVCVIKRISNVTDMGYMPDKSLLTKIHTHNLKDLVNLADLGGELEARLNSSNAFRANWNMVSSWNEAARYKSWNKQDAEDMLEALTEPNDGVLQWIKSFW